MEEPSRNIEIKAKVRNYDDIYKRARQLSGSDGVILKQRDTFYHVPDVNRRLKLREENGTGTLISYDRPNVEGPKLSKYKKCSVSDTSALDAVLADALGVRGSVSKQRILFVVGRTRIHIDKVENLGDFIELEVVLEEGQSTEEGQAIANQLMVQMGICETDLLASAYMDMLSQSS